MVYPPSEDTFLLLDALLEEWLAGKKFLEIGCGSGVISVEIARREADVLAVDIDPEAVKATEELARKEGVKLRVIVSDLFENIGGKFDIIAFNPPYLPSCPDDPAYDPAWSGGKGGIEVLWRFLEDAKDFLLENGRIYFVLSSLSDFKRIFSREDYTMEIVREKRFFMESIYVVRGVPCR